MSVHKMVCAAGAVVCILLFAAGTVLCPLLLVFAFVVVASEDPFVAPLATTFVELAFTAALFVLGIGLLGHAFLEAVWPNRVRPLGRS